MDNMCSRESDCSLEDSSRKSSRIDDGAPGPK